MTVVKNASWRLLAKDHEIILAQQRLVVGERQRHAELNLPPVTSDVQST